MTREELIKIIYNSSSTESCPKSMNCEKLIEIDLSETDPCWNCAEGLLTEYENKIYNKALDDCIKSMREESCEWEYQIAFIESCKKER